MLSNKTKGKLGKTFDELDNALENFRKEVVYAGISGFKAGEINDIYEMVEIYGKIIQLKNKVNEIRPAINGYVLDLAIIDLVTNSKKEKQDKLVVTVNEDTNETVELEDKVLVENDISIRRSSGELPVFVNISDGKNIHASARILSDKKVIISAGCNPDTEDDKISKLICSSREEILKKQLIPQENGGTKTNRRYQYKQSTNATNIIFGSKVNE